MYRKQTENKNGIQNYAYAHHIWRAWYDGSHTMMAKPLETLEIAYLMISFKYLLTESEVFTEKSQTEILPYWPTDIEADKARPKFEISPLRLNVRG